jgi:cysteinyl-tRNA synthetase
MSKSLGNVLGMRGAIDAYGPDGVRLFVLSSGYRSPLTYSEEAMAAGKSGAERLRNAATAKDNPGGEYLDASAYRDQFVAAMDEDFNTAQGVALLFGLAREINRASTAGGSVADAQAVLRELAGVLGLRLDAAPGGPDTLGAAPFIDLLIELRKELRAAKQYELADRVRSGLAEQGITLEDGPGGTTWKAQ